MFTENISFEDSKIRKIAFLFPGQGSQYVGMGNSFYENFDIATEIYDEANEILGFNIAKLSFDGPTETLTQTINTQPAILVHSYIGMILLQRAGIYPSVALGHSLGEYASMIAGGVFDFRTALLLVKERGRLMHEAVPIDGGAMLALLGGELHKAEQLCEEIEGVLEIANYNAPGQYVLSGERKSVEKACSIAREAGFKKAVMLPVGAPFHCSLLVEASEKMSQVLEETNFNSSTIPICANVTGKLVRESREVKKLLKQQMRVSVRWESSVSSLADQDISAAIEVGPGKVLSGLNKRILKNIPVFNVEDKESLDSTLLEIQGID
ncbi:MAG: ACP S-malonyltransferase [Nitrospinota bacterium]|nr:ACP S-malonyltransferase [Nitrospinota bacterium]